MIIILYVMDSLRPDFLSCYGYGKETSPHIDGLAQEGVFFTNAFSQATWTRASCASLITSTYPSVHGVLSLRSALSDTIPTLPEQLREKNVKTIAISSLGNISPDFGFGRGFDRFIELYKEKKVVEKRAQFQFDVAGWDKRDFRVEGDRVCLPTSEDINDFAFPILEEERERDLFMLVWSLDTHDPYFHRDMKRARFSFSERIWFNKEVRGISQKNDTEHLKTMYEDMIYYNDYHLGNLTSKLKELRLYDQTLLIVTSDHGEAFGEHGFCSHGREPFDELIRIPLVIKFPHAKFRGRVSELAEHVDIGPTVLEYLGVKTGNAFEQGKSLMPLLQTGIAVRDDVFAEYQLHERFPKFNVLRTLDHKYIELTGGKFSLGHWLRKRGHYWPLRWFVLKPRWLYDLKEDPEEKVDIMKKEKELAERFHRLVQKRLQENQKISRVLGRLGKRRGQVNEQVVRQLQALGYFD